MGMFLVDGKVEIENKINTHFAEAPINVYSIERVKRRDRLYDKNSIALFEDERRLRVKLLVIIFVMKGFEVSKQKYGKSVRVYCRA